MSRYVDRKTWRDGWEIARELPHGAQAKSFEAVRKSDGQRGFLKVLNDQRTSERRNRFHRESAAYDSLSHRGFPELIESNAHHHSDDDFNLYLVSEFVDGPALSNYASQHLDIDSAVVFTTAFLNILHYLHSTGMVHRDVKPDNIILRDANIADPVLVDFGLAFEPSRQGMETEIGQELGNRFLRLPELQAGSLAKQDPASDVTFAAGLIYYLLVGEPPNSLLDEQRRMPHQRETSLARFDRGSERDRRLLRVFDRAFAFSVQDRINSASELSNMIAAVMDETSSEDLGEMLKAFESELNTPELQTELGQIEKMDVVMNAASHANQKVAERLKVRYLASQSDFRRERLKLSSGYGLVDRLDRTKQFHNRVAVELVGNEITVSINGEDKFRLKWDEFDAGKLQRDFIEEFMISAMNFHRSLQ